MKVIDIENEYEFYKPYYERLQDQVFKIMKKIGQEKKLNIDIKKVSTRKKNGGTKIKRSKSIKDNFDKNGRYKGEKITNITEIPDIAGIRMICFSIDDQRKLAQNLITGGVKLYDTEFECNVDDKKEEKYKAVHADLSKQININGKGMVKLCCEVQIRTILQQAWAELDEKYTPKSQRNKKGESQTIVTSISNILFGCEDLWTITREKNKINEQIYGKKFNRIK